MRHRLGAEGNLEMEKSKVHKPRHLLLATANSYKVPDQELAPENCDYSLSQGAWILQDDGSLLVENPRRPRPATKKFDIETGEDQKGA